MSGFSLPPGRNKKGKSSQGSTPLVISTEVEVQQEESVEEPEPNHKMASMKSEISKLLKFASFEPEQRYWLETGFPDLNATLGSKRYGLAYGKIYELRGEESGGKTTTSIIIGAMAQKDGAAFGYIDLEDSYDDPWNARLGVDTDNVYLITPKLVKAKIKQKTSDGKNRVVEVKQIQSAEMYFAEAEEAMRLFQEAGYEKQFWLLDSVANIQTQMAVTAGTQDRNMRVNADRAMFLSNTLPMWSSLAANYNAMIFLINQLREKPGQMFGDPRYSPGGRALRHTCSIRADVKRGGKGGRMLSGKKVVGIKGTISNFKNKSGQGSVERCECGFKIRWDKAVAQVDFMPAEDIDGGE